MLEQRLYQLKGLITKVIGFGSSARPELGITPIKEQGGPVERGRAKAIDFFRCICVSVMRV
jgi:hypothetical protein